MATRTELSPTADLLSGYNAAGGYTEYRLLCAHQQRVRRFPESEPAGPPELAAWITREVLGLQHGCDCWHVEQAHAYLAGQEGADR